MPLVAPALQATQKAPSKREPDIFVPNDLSEEAKRKISAFVNRELQKIMLKEKLAVSDMMKMAMVCHGSVKSRLRATDSAKEIVLGSIDRTRTSPSRTEKGLVGIIKRLAREKRIKIRGSLED
jgi:hypothetical protein